MQNIRLNFRHQADTLLNPITNSLFSGRLPSVSLDRHLGRESKGKVKMDGGGIYVTLYMISSSAAFRLFTSIKYQSFNGAAKIVINT